MTGAPCCSACAATEPAMNAPVLVFGYGNPARGDDALGPALLERIASLRAAHPEWPDIELLCDFQLQVEHVLDLDGRERVMFVDADCAARPPFSWARVHPARESSCLTHRMTPQALLQVYERVLGAAPPPSFLLGIRGDRFELGEPVSDDAAGNLACAVAFTVRLLARPDVAGWEAAAHA